MKRIISLCLLLTVFCSALLLPSCDTPDDGNPGNKNPSHDLYPEGYTGGFTHQPGANIEYWWVETYEECLEAIELLKSHGSTFKDDTVLTYDGDLFDCKYCFMMTGVTGVGDSTEKIEWGDNPFDRRALNVQIKTYAFIDEVTIDEINHSYVSRHKGYWVASSPTLFLLKDEITEDNVVITEWEKRIDWDKEPNEYHKNVYYNDQLLVHVRTTFYATEEEISEIKMTDECIKEIVKYGKFIILYDN